MTDTPEPNTEPTPTGPDHLIPINIHMTAEDFNFLALSAGNWDIPTDLLDERGYTVHHTEGTPAAHNTWTVAYEIGDCTADALLARAYLRAVGHGHTLVWDTSEEAEGWIILTDYGDPTLQDLLNEHRTARDEIATLNALFDASPDNPDTPPDTNTSKQP